MRETVNQTQAEQQERRRNPAEQEILERRLRRPRRARKIRPADRARDSPVPARQTGTADGWCRWSAAGRSARTTSARKTRRAAGFPAGRAAAARLTDPSPSTTALNMRASGSITIKRLAGIHSPRARNTGRSRREHDADARRWRWRRGLEIGLPDFDSTATAAPSSTSAVTTSTASGSNCMNRAE